MKCLQKQLTLGALLKLTQKSCCPVKIKDPLSCQVPPLPPPPATNLSFPNGFTDVKMTGSFWVSEGTVLYCPEGRSS